MDRVAKGGLAWCHLSQKPRPEGVVGTSLLKKNRKEEGVASLRESWKDVDLADKISGIKALEPILDPSVFVTAHASKGGKRSTGKALTASLAPTMSTPGVKSKQASRRMP